VEGTICQALSDKDLERTALSPRTFCGEHNHVPLELWRQRIVETERWMQRWVRPASLPAVLRCHSTRGEVVR